MLGSNDCVKISSIFFVRVKMWWPKITAYCYHSNYCYYHMSVTESRSFHFSADILQIPQPLSVCVYVHVSILILNKSQREMRVHVFSRPHSTSGSCYSPCDLCVVRLHPCPHRSSVGEHSNDWVLLQFPGPPAIWVFTALLQASCWPVCYFFPSLSSGWCCFKENEWSQTFMSSSGCLQ